MHKRLVTLEIASYDPFNKLVLFKEIKNIKHDQCSPVTK